MFLLVSGCHVGASSRGKFSLSRFQVSKYGDFRGFSKSCKITFDSPLFKVMNGCLAHPNTPFCSVWLIRLEWGQFEYQLRKMKVVALLSLLVPMGQFFKPTIIRLHQPTYIFQIMLIYLDQVTVVYVKSFLVPKGWQKICSSLVLANLTSMIMKCSSFTSGQACTPATSIVGLMENLKNSFCVKAVDYCNSMYLD